MVFRPLHKYGVALKKFLSNCQQIYHNDRITSFDLQKPSVHLGLEFSIGRCSGKGSFASVFNLSNFLLLPFAIGSNDLSASPSVGGAR